MTTNAFFKPTPLYKEFMILDLIEKDANITQRKMSDALKASVSMINFYLEDYEAKGYIKRKYLSSKTVEYHITKDGVERKKYLNISYLNASQKIYYSARKNILDFLNQISDKGFKNILFYGAGEVAEIMLLTIKHDTNLDLNVLAVIDDEQTKQGQTILSYPIIPKDDIDDYTHDGILIATYGHHEAIYHKLMMLKYDPNKIVGFFTL